MIAFTRLPEPAVLKEKKAQWTKIFLEKRAKRPKHGPPSRQYGHHTIRNALGAMSFRKCFYCERKLDEEKGEIDHYIEVAEAPQLAFEWKNLYLSCHDCNRGKLPNTSIPAADCLDPCDPTINPAEHLTFDDELIRPKNSSSSGAKTIQKYQLDRKGLNYLRSKQLQRFYEILVRLQQRQLADDGRTLTADEIEALVHFKVPDSAYSLMFAVFLDKVGL